MNKEEFQRELELRRKEANKIVMSYLPKDYELQKTVFDAMEYAVSAGGKRLRPIIMKAVYDMMGGDREDETIVSFMAALEYIHTYSLIHDDLPELDNDDYRRGKKTTHIVFGHGMGLLAGDALLNYAFEIASLSLSGDMEHMERGVKALQILTGKAGIYGMIGGQVVDVEKEGLELSKEELNYINKNKTAALLEASMMIGAVLAGASFAQVEAFGMVARKVGLAFQIEDDILDITSTTDVLGKPVGSDEKNNKTTFATLLGIEKASKEVERLTDEAVSLLKDIDGDSEFLQELLLSLVGRKN